MPQFLPKNERTSARVAKIAGRIMQNAAALTKRIPDNLYHKLNLLDGVTPNDLKALAASALTQAQNRKKVKQ